VDGLAYAELLALSEETEKKASVRAAEKKREQLAELEEKKREAMAMREQLAGLEVVEAKAYWREWSYPGLVDIPILG